MMIKMDLNSSVLIEETENKQKQKEEKEEEEIIHVLAVDDSLIDRKLLEKLLTLSSYQVTCVESGDKALEYLGLLHSNDNINAEISDCTSCSSASSTCTSSSSSKQELQGSKVNLIMTDYSMPGMSGYDLLKIVKGSNSWKDVPVVVMSSENVPSRINMCLEGGAKEFMLKPLKLSDLKKLQSQLLVSSSSSSHCRDGDDDDDDDEEKIKTPPNFIDEINNNNIIHNESAISISSNKRKKAKSPDISELRPKLVKDIVVS